ncbi:MAG: isopentenyl phosphate kinase [Thermoplasmatota archaeon]
MKIIKLGGSLITYKGSDTGPPYRWNETNVRYRIKEAVIRETARVISPHSKEGIVLIHGGGTHGHRTVKRWEKGVVKGGEAKRIWEVKWRMLQLTETVVRTLGEEGINAVAVSPSDVIRLSGRSISSFDDSAVREVLRAGCVPVLRGDLVPDDQTGGWSVVSGDEIMVELVRKGIHGSLPAASAAIMCLDIEGFYRNLGGSDQELLAEIGPDDFHRSLPGWRFKISSGEEKGDVSGGVLRKVEACHRIAAMQCNAWMTGGRIKGSLDRILNGERSGTLFRAFQGPQECILGKCLISSEVKE